MWVAGLLVGKNPWSSSWQNQVCIPEGTVGLGTLVAFSSRLGNWHSLNLLRSKISLSQLGMKL